MMTAQTVRRAVIGAVIADPADETEQATVTIEHVPDGPLGVRGWWLVLARDEEATVRLPFNRIPDLVRLLGEAHKAGSMAIALVAEQAVQTTHAAAIAALTGQAPTGQKEA